MTTKLIILLVLGLLILSGIIWLVVKACRYSREHPDELLWPYDGELNERQEDKDNV